MDGTRDTMSPPPHPPQHDTRQYYSAYRGVAKNPDDDSFDHFIRILDPPHHDYGSWRFATEGKDQDDHRAFLQGFHSPEEVLIAQERGDGPIDNIQLRWLTGRRDSCNQKARVGTAAQHLRDIHEERRLLGSISSLRGFIPVYPIDLDGKLLRHRQQKYQVGSSLPQLPSLTNQAISFLPSAEPAPPYPPGVLRAGSNSGTTSIARVTSPPILIRDQRTRQLPSALHSTDDKSRSTSYLSPYGSVSPNQRVNFSAPRAPLLQFATPHHQLLSEVGRNRGDEKHNHQIGQDRDQVYRKEAQQVGYSRDDSPAEIQAYKNKGQLNYQAKVERKQEAEKGDPNHKFELDRELNSQPASRESPATATHSNVEVGCRNIEVNVPLVLRPQTVSQEVQSIVRSSSSPADLPDVELFSNIESEELLAGHREPFDLHTPAHEEFPNPDDPFDTALYPCIDCGESGHHQANCNIGNIQFTKELNFLDHRMLAERVERFDPGPWTNHWAPPPTPVPEDYATKVAGMAEVVRNEDSYKSDPDLHNLPDDVLLIIWALKTVGKR